MTSDISEISNGDVDDADERAIMLAENPEARRAIMERQSEERRERVAAKARRDALNAVDSFLRAANASGQDLEMLELQLKSALDTLEKDLAHHDKLVEAGTTRNGLKYAIEAVRSGRKRVRELRNTIERAKGAATTMKRSRGDVERAINSGVLDLDIDVIQNPQSYCRVPAGVLLRIGDYFRVLTDGDNSSYTGVVQIKKIYPERSEFDCRLMWKDTSSRYSSRSAGGSFTLPFNSVIEAVEVEKDAAEARMKAAAGVPSFQLSVELTREQFVDAIKLGQMVVKGKEATSYYGGGREKVNYWVWRDASGKLQMNYCSDGVIGNTVGSSANKDIAPEQWIYPDRNDELLKRELVARMNSDERFSENEAQGFLRAVFGYDYEKGMEAYGEQASYDDVVSIFDNWMSQRDLGSRSLETLTNEDVISVFRKPSGDGLTNFWEGVIGVRGFRGESKEFANKTEMEKMFYQIRDARIQNKVSKAQAGAAELGTRLFEQYKVLSNDQAKAMVSQMISSSASEAISIINSTQTPLDTEITLWIKAGTVIHAFEGKYLKADDFRSTTSVATLVNMAFNHLFRLKAGGYKDLLAAEMEGATWDEYLGVLTGNMSEEDVKSRLKDARLSREVTADASEEIIAEASADYSIELNKTPIVGKTKSRGRWFSINEGAEKVYLIADNPGSSTIYKAKNVIKSQFNGRFWNFEANPVAGVEYDRPAWIVSTHYQLDEIHAAIARA